VKTITIRLPEVDVAMLDEVRSRDRRFVSISAYLLFVIRESYAKMRGKLLAFILRFTPFCHS